MAYCSCGELAPPSVRFERFSEKGDPWLEMQGRPLPQKKTVEEIRQRLGLEHPEVWREKQRERFADRRTRIKKYGTFTLEDETRQTGRTTEMLVQALSKASEGVPVDIVGAYPKYEETLRRRFMSMAKEASIEVHPDSFDKKKTLERHTFVDHYGAFERIDR